MKKHYYLLSALVVYQKEKLERNKPLNILITSDEQFVTRTQLGRAQQQAQVRFFTEFDTERKCQVTDVFIQAVSYLGEMTEKEFHDEFYVETKEEAEPAPETAEDAPADANHDDAEQQALEEADASVAASTEEKSDE